MVEGQSCQRHLKIQNSYSNIAFSFHTTIAIRGESLGIKSSTFPPNCKNCCNLLFIKQS